MYPAALGQPFEARKLRVLNAGLFNLYQSRGAVEHDCKKIFELVTKRLKKGGHVGLLQTIGFYNTHVCRMAWREYGKVGARVGGCRM